MYATAVAECCVNCIVSRLEEKDSDSRKEYGKLHERYTDVCDFIV